MKKKRKTINKLWGQKLLGFLQGLGKGLCKWEIESSAILDSWWTLFQHVGPCKTQ